MIRHLYVWCVLVPFVFVACGPGADGDPTPDAAVSDANDTSQTDSGEGDGGAQDADTTGSDAMDPDTNDSDSGDSGDAGAAGENDATDADGDASSDTNNDTDAGPDADAPRVTFLSPTPGQGFTTYVPVAVYFVAPPDTTPAAMTIEWQGTELARSALVASEGRVVTTLPFAEFTDGLTVTLEAVLRDAADVELLRSEPVSVVQDQQLSLESALSARSRVPSRMSRYAGRPGVWAGRVEVAGTTPRERADAFLSEFGAVWGLTDPASQLSWTQVTEGTEATDMDVVSYTQWIDGVPVIGSHVAVGIKESDVVLVSAEVSRSFPTAPRTIGAAQAVAIARAAFDGSRELGLPRLRVYDWNLLREPFEFDAARTADWVWDVRLAGTPRGGELAEYSVLVSATGRGVLSLRPMHMEYPDMEVDDLNGHSMAVCGTIFDWGYWWPTDWEDEVCTEAGCDADADIEAHETFRHWDTVYDWYEVQHNRRSYNGGDAQYEFFVDAEISDGAWGRWTSVCSTVSLRTGCYFLQLVAHEMTHGVTLWLTNNDFEGSPRVLSESLAYVMGALIDGQTTDPHTPFQCDRARCDGTSIPDYFCQPHIHGSIDHMSEWNSPAVSDEIYDRVTVLPKVISLLAHGGIHPDSLIPVRDIPVYGRGLNWVVYEPLRAGLIGSGTGVWRYLEVLREVALAGLDPVWACEVINATAAVGVGWSDTNCDTVPDPQIDDPDQDGVPNASDNCPATYNPNQGDMDEDGLGNQCDPDLDGDGFEDWRDNCRAIANPDQADIDGNGIGEVCDDRDGDGVINSTDNCRSVPNADQANLDGDEHGDVCDPDMDGDGRFDTHDNCPRLAQSGREFDDNDGDGLGNACDNCPDVSNAAQIDIDNDGFGDDCDSDVDGDGVANATDNCPRSYNPNQLDRDNNGVGYACDLDERVEYASTLSTAAGTEVVPRASAYLPAGWTPLPYCVRPPCGDGPYTFSFYSALPIAAELIDHTGNLLSNASYFSHTDPLLRYGATFTWTPTPALQALFLSPDIYATAGVFVRTSSSATDVPKADPAPPFVMTVLPPL